MRGGRASTDDHSTWGEHANGAISQARQICASLRSSLQDIGERTVFAGVIVLSVKVVVVFHIFEPLVSVRIARCRNGDERRESEKYLQATESSVGLLRRTAWVYCGEQRGLTYCAATTPTVCMRQPSLDCACTEGGCLCRLTHACMQATHGQHSLLCSVDEVDGEY